MATDMFAEPGYIDCGCTSDAGNRPEVLIEVSSIGNTSQIKFLPYDHIIEVFNEYENFYHVQESNLHPSEKETCGISTFRDALKSLNGEIKLRTAKSSFETCSICNNLNDILKNTNLLWIQDQLIIKRLHLYQQAAERQDVML